MHVVATAGHVDHGKSTLVRALTGTDPDRLEEERRRGLTIELGYAWTTLPGLPGSGEVAFVDVPGHERFLATTLAGVGPVPVAMLVVAADDPWMPQAAEHLAALDALGVTHGLIVITRCDLADPAPAAARALAEVSRTSLARAPVVSVSALTGAGLDELRARLGDLLATVPAPPADGPVRLWVDRRFHIRGTGTVVTGTLPAGTITVGDTLVTDTGERVRVRGLEALGTKREALSGPARVALDLGGRAPEAIMRGTPLMSPGSHAVTRVVDVALTGPEGVPERPQLHIGSASLSVHARPLDERFCRLVLDAPLPLRVGDRAVLRDPGDRRIWGVEVVDPSAPPIRRRGAARVRAEALALLDGSATAYVELRGRVRREELTRLGLVGHLPADGVVTDTWVVAGREATRLRAALVEAVGASGADGLTAAESARALAVEDPALVEALIAEPLEHVAGRIRKPSTAALSPQLERALARIRQMLAEQPFAAPTADQLAAAGIQDAALAALHREGLVQRIAPGLVLLPDALDLAVARLATLPQPFTTSQARQALGTSRRVVLPLLARLDAGRRTVRLADDTRRLNQG